MIFEPLYTADEMRSAEAGRDVGEMMALAGRGVALEAMRAFPEAQAWTVVCGGGANGGDGRIAADVLREAGREALVVDAAGEDLDLGSPDAILDALFGTGFTGEPRPGAAALIERMNAAGVPVVSVDLPSGVDASTGELAGACIRSDLTVTMHAPKVGLVVAPGRFQAGEVVVAPIGVPQRATRHGLVTQAVLGLVPRKTAGDNKYTAGSVLVVGGAAGMTGAAALAARAAFRADAGYVAICAPGESLPVLETLVLEAVKRPLEELDAAVERASALAIGPGLGPDHAGLVRSLLGRDVPAVVDADALRGLEPFERAAPTVLTPHAGELGRLLGRDSAWVTAHRLAAAAEAVERFGCVVLLKGADTIIAAPGEGALVSAVDAPGLATAGTGDVLTGIVAAFLAKGMEPRLAAAAAATAHAVAAQRARKPRGLVASDVVEALPGALDAV